MRARLEDWMNETLDPLLDGPVGAPPGAVVSDQSQVSPEGPLRYPDTDPAAAPSS